MVKNCSYCTRFSIPFFGFVDNCLVFLIWFAYFLPTTFIILSFFRLFTFRFSLFSACGLRAWYVCYYSTQSRELPTGCKIAKPITYWFIPLIYSIISFINVLLNFVLLLYDTYRRETKKELLTFDIRPTHDFLLNKYRHRIKDLELNSLNPLLRAINLKFYYNIQTTINITVW